MDHITGNKMDFRRPALSVLLLVSVTFLAWHSVFEYLYGIRLLAAIELLVGVYCAILLGLVLSRPYSKRLALAYVVPLLSLTLLGMFHRDTPPNVFLWTFLMPGLSYSLLGRQLGLLITTIGAVLALLAYLLAYAGTAQQVNPLVLSNAVICLLGIWVVMHLYERYRENTTEALVRLATTDELTGLHNRRQLERVFTRLATAAKRQQQALAVVVMDLDHFKQINDRWGHHAGDQVLVHVARLLRENLRGSDWAFRIGGEEFCLFLPIANHDGAVTVAETLRRQIVEHPCHFEAHTIPLSASIGVVTYPLHGSEFSSLLALADQRMYQAKQQGRNRVIADGPPHSLQPGSATLSTSPDAGMVSLVSSPDLPN